MAYKKHLNSNQFEL